MATQLKAEEAFERARERMSKGNTIAEGDDLTGSGWSYRIADEAIKEYLEALALYRYAVTLAPEEAA